MYSSFRLLVKSSLVCVNVVLGVALMSSTELMYLCCLSSLPSSKPSRMVSFSNSTSSMWVQNIRNKRTVWGVKDVPIVSVYSYVYLLQLRYEWKTSFVTENGDDFNNYPGIGAFRFSWKFVEYHIIFIILVKSIKKWTNKFYLIFISHIWKQYKYFEKIFTCSLRDRKSAWICV